MPIIRVSHCGTDLQPDLTQPLWSPARSPVALQYLRAQPACRNRAPGAAFPFSQSAACSVLPKEKQRNQITAKTPSPGSSTGHAQVTGLAQLGLGRSLGGSCCTHCTGWLWKHALCKGSPCTGTANRGFVWVSAQAGGFSSTFLSDKQPPFGFNPSALI